MVKQKKTKSPPIGDSVIDLRDLSDRCIEILEHFGIEAPVLLNDYSTALEDALVEQLDKNKTQAELILKQELKIKQLCLRLAKFEPNE